MKSELQLRHWNPTYSLKESKIQPQKCYIFAEGKTSNSELPKHWNFIRKRNNWCVKVATIIKGIACKVSYKKAKRKVLIHNKCLLILSLLPLGS